ncbi:unnamed protein product, partial [Musa acuminata var. zebrina]
SVCIHRREKRRRRNKEEKKEEDEVRDGVRREPDPADDGGTEKEGRGAVGAYLRDAEAVREGQGQLKPPRPPYGFWTFDRFNAQISQVAGCRDPYDNLLLDQPSDFPPSSSPPK